MPIRTTVVATTVAVCALSALTLAACGRGDHGVKAVPGGGAKLNAGGEAPLWALQIRPKTLAFSSEQVASITVPNPGPTALPHGKLWSGAALGRPFRATVLAASCRDGATGLTYPMTAKVEVGGTTLQGCAATAGQGLGPRD